MQQIKLMKLKNGKILNANEKVEEHKVEDLEKNKKQSIRTHRFRGKSINQNPWSNGWRVQPSVWLARLLVMVPRWRGGEVMVARGCTIGKENATCSPSVAMSSSLAMRMSSVETMLLKAKNDGVATDLLKCKERGCRRGLQPHS